MTKKPRTMSGASIIITPLCCPANEKKWLIKTKTANNNRIILKLLGCGMSCFTIIIKVFSIRD